MLRRVASGWRPDLESSERLHHALADLLKGLVLGHARVDLAADLNNACRTASTRIQGCG
jgi:hypothetical protein